MTDRMGPSPSPLAKFLKPLRWRTDGRRNTSAISSY
eukprot:CAMPEP_0171886880 /NCGR_PEP_ID=MMETSP0992-20121227/42139_1 /TAXON_ID=483369 /ORGANISM="non described non described, Strain CCMP2098" /LENGTH=35 /DNA_ID= /DNA_START= /DNA_END= /DNA_ORIENTATION=